MAMIWDGKCGLSKNMSLAIKILIKSDQSHNLISCLVTKAILELQFLLVKRLGLSEENANLTVSQRFKCSCQHPHNTVKARWEHLNLFLNLKLEN